MLIRRGGIFLVNFAPAREGEANYTRPAIVVSANTANEHLPVVVVVPLTSNIEQIYPWQLLLPNNRTDLDRDSKAQVELIRHVSSSRLLRRLGHVPENLMVVLDSLIREHLAL